MKTQESIHRVVRFPDQKFWFEAISFKVDYPADMSNGLGFKWFNCLYIKYVKEDFPNIKGPINGSYYEADIAKLDWHCGITFYEETSLLNHAGRTIVKAGCDFQHLYDDHYMTEDYGQRIIDRCVPGLKNQFISLISGAEVTA
jgi:hypothetical protein